ncbi:MAG TPA: ABC transporter ATP-binding protein [Acidimicrobiales bacterium]|nr:ABC transporter ATP-binding protein [Acidimicrobiales bacterium]
MDRPSPAPLGWVRRLGPWLRPHRRKAAVALAGALVGSLVSAGTPLVERQILDRVILVHRSPLAPWLALLIVLAAVSFVAAYVRRYHGGRVSLDVQLDLRNAIYDRLSRLDFARHDEMQTGQLVSRANSDVGLLQALLAFLPIMAGNAVLLVTAMVVMFVLSPPLAALSLVAVPAMFVAAYRMRRMTFPANWHAQQKEGEVAVVVEEAVTGVRVVKGFGQERREIDRLVDKAQELYGSNLRATRLQARYQPVLAAIPQVALVGVLALGGYLALRHRIPLGTFLAFSTYMVLLSSPARMLANVLLVAQQARAGAERVLDLLASTPLVVDRPGARPLPPAAGAAVRFQSVRFGYLSSQPVLDGFELALAPGETVALVGASGSGKSTAALLLPRFYDVQAGAVRVDGHDVRDVTMASLRSQIGVVFEESFLFSDTVRANIAYGRPDASEAEVEAAARMAEAHEFVSALPAGYDTVVGERPHTLRRPAPAHRPGPGPPHRSPHPRPRRRHERRRRPDRGGDPRHPPPGDARPDHPAHRPPPLDAPPGQPDRRRRPRPGGRRGHARRAAGGLRHLSHAPRRARGRDRAGGGDARR